VTETGFGLVFGFINRLQVVTTITYNTVLDLHNLHYNLLSLFPLVFTIRFLATDLNTGILQVWLHHTLPISLYYSTHKVFKSHVKSSQTDLLFPSVLLVPIRSLVRVLLPRLLFTRNWTTTLTAFTSHLELSSFGTELNYLELNYLEYYQSRVIASARQRTENLVVLLVSANHTENISRGSYCCVRDITPRTSHVTPTAWFHWRADRHLATSFKH
jgi:hypothetical protein